MLDKHIDGILILILILILTLSASALCSAAILSASAFFVGVRLKNSIGEQKLTLLLTVNLTLIQTLIPESESYSQPNTLILILTLIQSLIRIRIIIL